MYTFCEVLRPISKNCHGLSTTVYWPVWFDRVWTIPDVSSQGQTSFFYVTALQLDGKLRSQNFFGRWDRFSRASAADLASSLLRNEIFENQFQVGAHLQKRRWWSYTTRGLEMSCRFSETSAISSFGISGQEIQEYLLQIVSWIAKCKLLLYATTKPQVLSLSPKCSSIGETVIIITPKGAYICISMSGCRGQNHQTSEEQELLNKTINMYTVDTWWPLMGRDFWAQTNTQHWFVNR